MLSRLGLGARGPSDESTQSSKPFPFSMSRIRTRTSSRTSERDIEMDAATSQVSTTATAEGPTESRTRVVSQIGQARLRPHTRYHRVMRHIAPLFRNLTLPIPAAMVILIIFVHVGAQMGIWKVINAEKGGPASPTWAPFWVTIPYVRTSKKYRKRSGGGSR